MSYDIRGFTKVVDLWLVELVDKKTAVKIDPQECQAFAWVQLHDAVKLGAYDATKKVLKEADDFVKAHILSSQ